MDSVTIFLSNVIATLSSLPFGILATVVPACFGGVAALYFVACAFCRPLRQASKRPLLHFLNCFTALYAATLLIGLSANHAAFFASLFWLAGYLLYGLACAAMRPKGDKMAPPAPLMGLPAAKVEEGAPVPPARGGGVRLGHALAIAERLLLKGLSRADRVEAEGIKRALSALSAKGSLTPAEAEEVNARFAALLKLMAKYNY